jgi:ABC-type uncharacterized transport system permease subunit
MCGNYYSSPFFFFFGTRAQCIGLGWIAICRLIVQPWIPPLPLIVGVPASAARCLHVHTTLETLVAKSGTW